MRPPPALRRFDGACALAAAWAALAGVVVLAAQVPAGPNVSSSTPRAEAPFDLTGYWVSIVSEDWRWRMVTPPKGDYTSVPLNDAGRRVADAWDPAKDQAGGHACKAYGAAAIMRVPGRLHITWLDENTLKIETDAGSQTRLLHFGAAPAPRRVQGWQGYSRASWDGPAAPAPGWDSSPRAVADGLGRAATGPRYSSLKVLTTGMRAGYLRRNGVPYSDAAVVTEHYDRYRLPNGEWLTITTIVDDPAYLTAPFITSTDFRKEPDGSKWRPTPCTAG